MSQAATETHPRVVIVGAGFGGLTAAKRLAKAPLDVTIVDLFQPLLYQVATASLSPADIASPIRAILRNVDNVKVILAKVSGVDIARREVVAEGRRIPFDCSRWIAGSSPAMTAAYHRVTCADTASHFPFCFAQQSVYRPCACCPSGVV